MKFFPTCILFLITSLSKPLFAKTAILTLRADTWCPYNCNPKVDKKNGYIIEIAEKIFQPKGIKIDYKVISWTRAKKDVSAGVYDGLVGATKSDGDFIYSKKPLGMLSNALFVLKETAWSYKGLDSLRDVKVGVINEYSYGKNALKIIKEINPSFVKITGDDALPNLIKMLELKRITALYENPTVITYKMNSLKKDIRSLQTVGTFDQTAEPVYIGFSKKFPKAQEYADLIDEQIPILRKTGVLKKILTKYNIKDWEK